PVGFIYDLGLAASLNMSDLYENLLLLQEDYYAYLSSQGKKKKKHIE
ncbi:type III secretion system protein PrgN, partial [Enterococcus mundtii]|nr:type III secretion system protein PrgN [Enterococcus mundtii]